jgi:hypothetical protein
MPESQVGLDDLWIEHISRVVGFETVSKRFTGTSRWAPYLFIVAVIGLHLPVLSFVGWLQTGRLSIAANPGEIFQVIAWPAVVWMLLRTKRKYAGAVQDLPDAIDEDIRDLDRGRNPVSRLLTIAGVPANPSGKTDANLNEISSPLVRYSVLCAGLAFYAWQLLTNPAGLVGPVADLTGPVVATVRFYLIIPFVLYPIGAEFLAVVIGALVLLPFKIRRAGLIDFSDPHGYAGLEPTGEMFKNVSVSYFILLTLFMLFQTVAVGASPMDQFSLPLLLAGLLVGLILFFGPMLWMKSFINAAKHIKIEALAEQSREVGSTEDIFPYAEPESVEDANQYTYNHIRMQRVEMASEFPLNITMIQEVLFALLLPYITSLAFDFVLQNYV